MKKLIISLMAALLICACPEGAMAQSADGSYIEKFTRSFYDSPQFEMELSMVLYKNHTSSAVVSSLTGTVRKWEHRFISSLSHVDLLENDAFSINCNHQAKRILVAKKKSSANAALLPGGLDSLLVYADEPVITVSGDQTVYRFLFTSHPNMLYSGVTVVVDNTDGRMRKMILYYLGVMRYDLYDNHEEAPRMEITYQRFNTGYIPAAPDFSESRFIRETNGKYTGVGKYSSYQIITVE